MKTLDFSLIFPDEQTCREHFRNVREQQGITCKKCSSKEHNWKEDYQWWECTSCRHRTSLKAGTVMERSKLPVLYWFKTMHMMTCRKTGISALAMQEELGHKRYEPIWQMMHKLRSVMGKRDSSYQMDGTFEMDEGFFEHAISDHAERARLEEEGPKRGRGSEEKAKVLVMVGSEPVENHDPKKHDKKRKCGYLKMKVITDLKAETIEKEVQEKVDKNAIVETDDSTSYTNLKKLLKEHIVHNVPKKEISKALPWVHTAISNAKRKLVGTFYMVSDKYIQYYLDEFCYMFNRRYFKEKPFNRLVIAAATLVADFNTGNLAQCK
jgi:hypothetical protein